mgnify:CR=1 FL=1
MGAYLLGVALFALGIAVSHHKRCIRASVIRHQVVPLARDARHFRTETKPGSDGRDLRERLQILRHDLLARRQLFAARRRNILRSQQFSGRGIDIVIPRRKNADVAPFEDCRAAAGAFLKKDWAQVAFNQTCGGRKAHWTGADHCNGQFSRVFVHFSIFPEYSN